MDTRIMNVFSAEMEKAATAQYLQMGEMVKEAGGRWEAFKQMFRRAPAEDVVFKNLQERGVKQFGSKGNPFAKAKNLDDITKAYTDQPGLKRDISSLTSQKSELSKRLKGSEAAEAAAQKSLGRWRTGALAAGGMGLAGMGGMHLMGGSGGGRPSGPQFYYGGQD